MNNPILLAFTARLLIPLGLFTGFNSAGYLWAQKTPGGSDELRLIIVQGEGFVNNVKKRVARDPVVEVRDRNNKPVAGAAVIFLLPSSGPSGTFANGTQMLTATTDNAGRAVGTGLHPNSVTGSFKINVTASYQGKTSTAIISGKNIAAAGGIAGMGTAATVGILGAVAAGIAVGVVKATGGGGKTASANIGTPTVQ